MITDRQTDKHSKYSKEQLPGGYTPDHITLVFEYFSGWREVLMFLTKFSKLHGDEERRNNRSDFKTHWTRCLSVQLQLCNASVLARKIIRVTHGQKAIQSLDVVHFQFSKLSFGL